MDWNEEVPEASTITLAQMDEMVRELNNARLNYETAKRAQSEAHDTVKRAEAGLMASLKALGRTSYDCEGIGKISYYTKETYTTPKENEAKAALFSYIEEKYGGDALTSMLSINHNTLGSWANKETESGEIMQIPGLGQPSMVEILSFRKSGV